MNTGNKFLTAMLIASLGINAAIGTALLRSGETLSPGSAPAARTVDARVSRAPASPVGARTAPAKSDASIRGSSWAELTAGPIESMPERLRAAGFPPAAVRAIVQTMVNERFGPRQQEMMHGNAEEYWKPPSSLLDTPEKRAGWESLNRERYALVKQILGPEHVVADEGSLAYYRRQHGDLPPEKIIRLQQLFEDYGELRSKITPGHRMAMPDELPKLAALENEMRADLARLLTPAELEQYDLRSSHTANYLRGNLELFVATEAEYRALYHLYEPLVKHYYNHLAPIAPEERERADEAEEKLLPALKAALGPERYADFQQTRSPQHRQLNQVVARLGLPISAARAVAQVHDDITQRAAALRNDATLAPDARDAQLAALAQEAQLRVTNHLSQRGVDAYKQYGGQWMNNIVPRPRFAPKGQE